jgi:hypothetical protein
MAVPRVFFVHLRRPGSNDPRTDPLYECGSFGCTRCHSRNLLNPRHARELEGSRLAFVQGGASTDSRSRAAEKIIIKWRSDSVMARFP